MGCFTVYESINDLQLYYTELFKDFIIGVFMNINENF